MVYGYNNVQSDDSDEGIVEYNYVDEPPSPTRRSQRDDGVYAPSNCVLCLLVVLILLVGGGIGVGTYFAYQEISDDGPGTAVTPSTPAPTPPPVPSPTPAPINPPPPTNPPTPLPTRLISTPAPVELFVCPICGEGREVTNPNGVLTIEGQTDRSCQELLVAAELGNINEVNCGLLQSVIQDVCGCQGPRTEESVLALLETVVGPAVREEGSVYFNAANWILNEDPRFLPLTRRRQLQFSGGDEDFYCHPCGEGFGITMPDSLADVLELGLLICWQLAAFGDEINSEMCDMVQDAAFVSCGCEALNNTYTPCTLCRDGLEPTDLDATVDFEGQLITCEQFQSLLDSSILSPDQCFSAQELTEESCGCLGIPGVNEDGDGDGDGDGDKDGDEDFVCPPCGEGYELTNPIGELQLEGFGVFTCQQFAVAAESGLIAPADCDILQEVAFMPCGCEISNNTNSEKDFFCTVCEGGGEPTNIGGVIIRDGEPDIPCQQAVFLADQGNLTESQCEVLQEIAAMPCDCEMLNNTGSEEDIVCTMCKAGSEPTNLEGSIFIGDENITCVDLQALLQTEMTSPDQCVFIQGSAEIPCGCEEITPGEPSLPPIPSIPDDEDTTLSDLSDDELIQRYLAVLFYYQTTNNTANSWNSTCGVVENSDIGNSTCNYITPARLENGELALGVPPEVVPSSRWLSAESECDWAGITCINGAIESIFLVQFGLSGTLPTEIVFLPSLRWLDFAYNMFTGTLPSAYLSKLQNLELNHNDLSGDEFGSTALWENSTIESLNVAANQLTGVLPTNTNENLQRLFAYSNMLIGTIPQYYLAGEIDLFQLDLSNNRLVGPVPPVRLPDASKGITYLALSSNQLQGGLVLDSAKLTSLKLDDNRFPGDLPAGLAVSTSLVTLSLSGNRFRGAIPDFIGDLIVLSSLQLSGNSLSGTLPTSLGQLDQLINLDLSNNSLEGNIPTEFLVLDAMESLNLSSNQFTGTLPTEFGQLTNLVRLELHDNMFFGTIPSELLRMTDLSVLTLNRNSFVGTVPVEFCDVSYDFELLRADCTEITCDCCTECCSSQGACTAVALI